MLSNLMVSAVVAGIIGALVALVVGAGVTFLILIMRKKKSEKTVETAKEIADRLIEEAKLDCKNMRKEASIEA